MELDDYAKTYWSVREAEDRPRPDELPYEDSTDIEMPDAILASPLFRESL